MPNSIPGLLQKFRHRSPTEENDQGQLAHQSPIHYDEICLKIQGEIEAAMYHGDSDSEKFICEWRLNQVWSNYTLEQISAFQYWDKKELDMIKRDYVKVLSILILIGWPLNRFRPVFYVKDKLKLDDSKLFYKKGNLRQLEGQERSFLSTQYLFKPEVIIAGPKAYIQEVQKESRLPFTDESEPLGQVSFNYEVKNLAFLKEGLTDKSVILKHLAAVAHDQKLFILFPVVKHFDLETLLQGGGKLPTDTMTPKQKYSLKYRFPQLADTSKRHRAIIEQAYNLADALQWLHFENGIFGEPDRYLAHMDLKPENILIDGDPSEASSPAGSWRISDFGISAHSKAAQRPATGELTTLRDFTSHVTDTGSLSAVRRANGPYQPPEVALEREKVSKFRSYSTGEPSLDERQCDAWSFACILCSLLAFALGMTEGHERLLEQRSQLMGDDNFYSFKTSSWNENSLISDQNTEIKGTVVEWLDQMKQRSEPWVAAYISMLEKTMVVDPNPAKRENLTFIKPQLKSIEAFLRPQAGLGTGNGPMMMKNNIAEPPLPLPYCNGPVVSIEMSETSRTRSQDSYGNQRQTLSGLTAQTPAESLASSGPPLNSDEVSADSHYQSAFSSVQHRLKPAETFRYKNARSFGPSDLPINALAIEWSGERVAFLSKDTVHVWPTMEDAFPDQVLQLHKTLNRPKLKLNYPYLAVLGDMFDNERFNLKQDSRSGPLALGTPTGGLYMNLAKCGQAEVHDLSCRTDPTSLSGKLDKEILVDVLIASTGATVCLYRSRAQLQSSRTVKPFELDIPSRRSYIHGAAFGKNGLIVFLWTKGASQDHVYLYEVDHSGTKTQPTKILDLKSEPQYHGPQPSVLWPSVGADFCIVYEHSGAFIAHPAATGKIKKREVTKMENVVQALMPNDGMLLCIVRGVWRSTMSTYSVVSEGAGGINLKKSKIPMKESVSKNAVMAVQVVNDRSELVICCPEKGIFRYTQP
ncbi:MAG: hypothetical protein Q9225_004935 [Loekoesia sp. 1 TL-2023]